MPETPPDQPATPSHDERLESIETAIAFQAHEQDALNAQVITLNETVDALQRRLRRLESRLEEVSIARAATDDQGARPADDAGVGGTESPGDDQIQQDRPPHWGRTPGRPE